MRKESLDLFLPSWTKHESAGRFANNSDLRHKFTEKFDWSIVIGQYVCMAIIMSPLCHEISHFRITIG